jgi:hypothetical protein
LLGLSVALGASACALPVEPDPSGTWREPIIHGELTSDEQNSTVLIWNSRQLSWCTGAVIAPTLVMTARHCLFSFTAGRNNYVECNESGLVSPVEGAFPPASLSVSVGKEAGRNLEEVALGINVYSGSELDLCTNDVGILEVDTPLPVDRYALRLDAPPVRGERGTLIGWGATEADRDAPRLRLTDARRQREIDVLFVGAGTFTPPGGTSRFIEAPTFVGTEGGCSGDSGGPLISKETGAVFGVFHAMQHPDPTTVLEGTGIDQCLGGFSVFHRLDLQADWIRRAFRKVGEAPWIENRPFPAEVGASCELADDCASGLCVSAGKSAFCSMRCDDDACPEGMECVGEERERVCVLSEVESAEAPYDGCSVARGPRNRSLLGFAAPLAVVVASWFRLRRRSRSLRDARP